MGGTEILKDRYSAVKPKMRGLLHLVAAPIAGIATIGLAIAASPQLRWPAILFAVTTILLFTTSAVYHRGTFTPRITGMLQRWDHANIFLIIAGSATPFAVALLDPGPARTLLAVLWLGAVGGALVRVLWARAPRWLFVPLYLLLGWVSAMYMPGFLASHQISSGLLVAIVTLIATGGVLYTIGAGVFAARWPNPWPRWFGFHEVFHSFTIGGWLSHYVAAALVVGALR